MTTQNTRALVTDAERAEFESIFPTPSACIWHGNGYAATGYNAWDAHKHIERWNGWRSARQSSAQSDASPESEDLQKTKVQLAQAEQEITAYDMTMNRQSKLIAELQAQLEAVGAGGVTALLPKAERKPLTDAEITSLYFESLGQQRIQDAALLSRIVRAVERHHGITEPQGGTND